MKERADKATEKGSRPARSNLLESLIHIDPVHIVSDIWDAFDMWRVTRRWRPILMMIPGILLLVTSFVTITYGMMAANTTKLDKYAKKADAVSPIKEDGLTTDEKKDVIKKATTGENNLEENALKAEDEESELADLEKKALAEQEAKNADYADLLFRRVLQLEPNNKQARYFVAYQLGVRGNVEQARAMMQSLAPADTTAYPRAHAWMAGDMLQQVYRGQKVDRNELTHHLTVAAEWQGTSPFVLSAYSQMLESEGKINEAISMLQRAAARDHAFYLPLSAMMARNNHPVQSREMADRAISHYSESFGKKDEPDRDRIAVAEAYVQAKKFEEAVRVLQEGLKLRDNRPLLRRAISNVYRLMYKSQLTKTEAGIKANLGLLNAAMMADPTNPGVGEEIAWLQTLGVTADDKMIQSLREQLASGGASAIMHLLLGNAYMNKKNMDKAISHWQLSLGQDPNLVLALNNLAIGFSMLDPPRIDEALKLIDKAIELSRGDAEFLDSKGEILDRGGRHAEAIIQYEKAIQVDPMRIATREKLVRAYEAAGMMEDADAQLSIITKIREQLKAAGLNERGRPIPNTPPPPKPEPTPEVKTDPVEIGTSDLFKDLPSETSKPAAGKAVEK